jgi:hypothetical protein
VGSGIPDRPLIHDSLLVLSGLTISRAGGVFAPCVSPGVTLESVVWRSWGPFLIVHCLTGPLDWEYTSCACGIRERPSMESNLLSLSLFRYPTLQPLPKIFLESR